MDTIQENLSAIRYEGKILKVTCPCGRQFSIREKNGDDDDIISRIGDEDSTNFENINNYIAALIVENHETGDKYITPSDVAKLPNTTRYYLLLKMRLHNDGDMLVYKNKCSNEKCGFEEEFIEDLKNYDADLTDTKSYEKTKTDFEYQIFPYKNGKDLVREFNTSSGKKLRYTYLNGESELKVLEMKKSGIEIGKNISLQARNLEFFDGTSWQRVGSFAMFNSKEMREIRTDVEDNDPQWVFGSECTCPKCKTEHFRPMISIGDFFFPLEG